jgi:hypothetical protein
MDELITVKVLREAGYEQALYGTSLNKLQPIGNMPRVCGALAKAQAGSHRKFLRAINVWLGIRAPMYWWCEFDTYKVGTTRLSSSTMHCTEAHSTQEAMSPLVWDKVYDAFYTVLEAYGEGSASIEELKANMPAGVILESMVALNYEVLRTMINDRYNHKLASWRVFCDLVLAQLEHPELICLTGEQQ